MPEKSDLCWRFRLRGNDDQFSRLHSRPAYSRPSSPVIQPPHSHFTVSAKAGIQTDSPPEPYRLTPTCQPGSRYPVGAGFRLAGMTTRFFPFTPFPFFTVIPASPVIPPLPSFPQGGNQTDSPPEPYCPVTP
ncbi:hypothetical protein [Endozoicomonas sp. ALB060]|uniref:hypothetical protein n=1 Tax=Endozoicomonas sp. ALB060 TaxID=3403072 RepID=UPI003BB532D4